MPLAARIARPALRRAKPLRDGMSPRHLASIRQLPCVVCGREPCGQAHHLMGLALGRGMGRKNADRWAIGLCLEHHAAVHDHGDDESWLAGHGIDGRALAGALWSARGDLEGMRRIVERFRIEVLRRSEA